MYGAQRVTELRCTDRYSGRIMQAEIQPSYSEITAKCSCGNVVNTRSTLGKDIHIDVCSQCHPFYTGKQKVLDSGGRIDKFNKRFGAITSKK